MADVTKVKVSSRIELVRDGVTLYKQQYAPTEQTFGEYVSDRLVLATNMTTVEQVDLGGVSSGEFVLLETDNTISVGVNSQTNLISVGQMLALGGATLTSLYLQNTSTDVEATVQISVVD